MSPRRANRMPKGPAVMPQVARYEMHKEEIDAAVAEVFQSGRYILGPQTDAFEKEFAAFLGVGHCVGVGSGTDALELALRACGIGRGDAVLTVSHTAVATVAAIERAGAVPVLVDIDPATFTMSPDALKRTIKEFQASPRGARTALKAVIPVHLYGQAADMPEIMKIAIRHNLRVIEDCAQSHGAMLMGKMTGTWGDLAAFSFYPTKNLGAFGDGGAVVTGDNTLAEKVRRLREYGWVTRQLSASPGLNSRLDEMQSAVLRVLLKYLEEENARRRTVASSYGKFLASTFLGAPRVRNSAEHVFHQYVIRTPLRDELKSFLEADGINTQIHYPCPIHLQPAYRGRLFHSASGLPETEAAAREVLSLPMSPHLMKTQFDTICGSLSRWLERARPA